MFEIKFECRSFNSILLVKKKGNREKERKKEREQEMKNIQKYSKLKRRDLMTRVKGVSWLKDGSRIFFFFFSYS